MQSALRALRCIDLSLIAMMIHLAWTAQLIVVNDLCVVF
jgi:hypothetical protein